VALEHSQEMLELGYFAHISPLRGSPTDRMDAAGVSYSVAGENIAYAPTVNVAERGLMRSPGHRANILSSDFTRIGIGVIVTPFGTRMFTQEFAGP
ncbi:MAG: CAP domain-containing protein, partial [Nitrolancea sp.]